jgi:hypothetical protein
VVDVVEEPDMGLMLILFKRNRVAVRHVKNAIVSVFAEKNSDDTLGGATGYSVVVVDDRKKNGGVNNDILGNLGLDLLDEGVRHFELTKYFNRLRLTSSAHSSSRTLSSPQSASAVQRPLRASIRRCPRHPW